MTNVAAAFLMGLIVALVMLILTKKYRFPLLMDLGMGMVALGLVGAVDSLLTDTACTAHALAARWGLVGGGLFVMFVSLSMRLSKSKGRRKTDIVTLSPEDMVKVRGRGKE